MPGPWRIFRVIRHIEVKIGGCTTIMAQFSSTSGLQDSRHTCIIPQNVCTYLCLINIYSKTVHTPLAWGPEGGENIGKPSYYNLPPDIGLTLFTPIKGRMDSLTVYIYKAETCTYILRYNTCMCSYPDVLYYPEYPSRSWHPILAA
jgi:hypothetical protein